MTTFKQQYMHPNWQKRRLEIMNVAGFECQNCGDKEETLNVHHKRYFSGRKVWEYADNELECLDICELVVDGVLETAKLGPY